MRLEDARTQGRMDARMDGRMDGWMDAENEKKRKKRVHFPYRQTNLVRQQQEKHGKTVRTLKILREHYISRKYLNMCACF